MYSLFTYFFFHEVNWMEGGWFFHLLSGKKGKTFDEWDGTELLALFYWSHCFCPLLYGRGKTQSRWMRVKTQRFSLLNSLFTSPYRLNNSISFTEWVRIYLSLYLFFPWVNGLDERTDIPWCYCELKEVIVNLYSWSYWMKETLFPERTWTP